MDLAALTDKALESRRFKPDTAAHYQRLAQQAAKLKEDRAIRKAIESERRRRVMATCKFVTINVDGVEMEAWITEDRDLEMLLVGGVDIAPALDTISGCRKEWYEYLDALIDRELAMEAA